MQAGRLHVELTEVPAPAADIAKVPLIIARRPADLWPGINSETMTPS